MLHPVHKVRAVEVVGDYCLRIEFADGLARTIDFRPVLEGDLYAPLRDLSMFNAVSLDHDVHTLVWPNGADFDPATLHDWADHEAHMVALARRWASVRGSSEAGQLNRLTKDIAVPPRRINDTCTTTTP